MWKHDQPDRGAGVIRHRGTARLVGDVEDVGTGLTTTLTDSCGIEVLGLVLSCKSAVASIDQIKPSIVVVRAEKLTKNWFDCVAELKRAGGKIGVILLAGGIRTTDIAQALKAGADAILPLTASAESINKAIREVGAGRIYVSAEATKGKRADSLE